MNYEDVIARNFKDCPIHTELRYASPRCPVCAAIEERDLALGQAEYEKTQLEGKIDDLENRLQGYKDELGL